MTVHDIVKSVENTLLEYLEVYLALEITKIIYKVVLKHGEQ